GRPVAVVAAASGVEADAAGRLGETGPLERAAERDPKVVSNHGGDFTAAGSRGLAQDSLWGERIVHCRRRDTLSCFTRGARITMLREQAGTGIKRGRRTK